jgi:hypothetical protein
MNYRLIITTCTVAPAEFQGEFQGASHDCKYLLQIKSETLRFKLLKQM